MKSKKGFTLIELIIVLAIIAIIGAIAVPLAFTAIDSSKKTVCEANRTTARRMIPQDEALRGSLYTAAEIEAFVTDNKIVCPKGGTITSRRLRGEIGMNAIIVACSIHVDGTYASRGVWMDFMRFIDDNPSITSNDDLRRDFLAANGGKWPTLTVDGTTYYIQPFYSQTADKNLPLEDRVWLYATTDTGTANNWFVPFVFNPATEKWYKATKYDGTGSGSGSINNVKDVYELEKWVTQGTHSSGEKQWNELKDFKEGTQK